MKVIVFLLVLANLLFLAYTEGYFGHSDNPDAGRVEQQVMPERIKVIARGEPPPAKETNGKEGNGRETATAAPVEVAETPKSPTAEPAKAEAREEPKPVKEVADKEKPANVCVAWNSLAPAEADRLSALLAEKFDVFRQARRVVASEGSGWWVFIPPLASKADAEKKANELKGLGVSDYFVIQDAGPNRYALSLGVFSAESGAKDRLAELKGKGVKSARVGPRPGKDALHVLEAVGPAERESALREAVAGVLPKIHAQDCR